MESGRDLPQLADDVVDERGADRLGGEVVDQGLTGTFTTALELGPRFHAEARLLELRLQIVERGRGGA